MIIQDKLQGLREKGAERVFEGVLFDVYEWPQKMFDGSTATFERIVRPDTVAIFTIVDNKLVLNIEEQPGSMPKIDIQYGRLEKEETNVEEAALRELKEETGITPKELYYIGSERPGSKLIWDIYFFIAVGIQEKTNQKLDGGEKIDITEISLEEAYDRFKTLEIDLPDILLKELIAKSKEEFLEYFRNPREYFDKVYPHPGPLPE